MFGNKINKILKTFKLDENNKRFINLGPLYKAKNTLPNIGIIESVKDYQFLARALSSLDNKEVNHKRLKIFGLWTYINLSGTLPKKNNSKIFLSYFLDKIIRRKWSKLYCGSGIAKVINLGHISSVMNVWDFLVSIKVYFKIRNAKKLHGLSLNETLVGDLIYSSYIRFREEETVDYKDLFILFLIYKTLVIQRQIKQIVKAYKVDFYITSYCSYVQHGVAVREFLKHEVKVYSLGNIKPILKLHASNDYTHKFRYWEYDELIARLPHVEDLRQLASKELCFRFSGGIDPEISYMKESPYAPGGKTLEASFDGILFLHDFFDSAFDHRSYLFDDLYQWATHTLSLTQKNNLNIAVKPHPNGIPENRKIIDSLKDAYPEIYWIDEGVSNSNLIKNSKAVISVFGSILYEAAFNDRVAIAAGEYPGYRFKLAYQPLTVLEYDNLLCNLAITQSLPDAKSGAIDFYLCNSYLLGEGNISLDINEEGIDWSESSSLLSPNLFRRALHV